MKALNDFKTWVSNTGSSGVNAVFLDYETILNSDINKSYPFVFWLVNTIKGTENNAQNTRKFSIKVAIIQKWIAEEQLPGNPKINAFDSIHQTFKDYLTYLDTVFSNFAITNRGNIPYEYYDRGMTSVDEEIAIIFSIELQAFC